MIDPPRPVLTDLEIDQSINLYEQKNPRRMLTPAMRQSIRILARQQPTEPRKRRHPLGINAADDQNGDHCTPENRAAIRACLGLYYDTGQPANEPYRGTPLALQEEDVGGALADQINQRRDAATGMELADRLVSRMELGTALAWLSHVWSTGLTVLERRYRDGWTWEQLGAVNKVGERQARRYETDAVDMVIGQVFGESWTEAKSADMQSEGQ